MTATWSHTESPAGFMLYYEWEAQSGFPWPVASLLPGKGRPTGTQQRGEGHLHHPIRLAPTSFAVLMRHLAGSRRLV